MLKEVIAVLRVVGLVILVVLALLALLLLRIFTAPMVPRRYTQTVETGGEIEAAYLTPGGHRVKYAEMKAPGDWKKFEIYYPADLEESEGRFPAVVLVNGTGVYGSRYRSLFRHLASWGFIVLGNEDPSTCTGDSAEGTLACLLGEDENPESIFYHRVDRAHIGISGHSQGGVGVFNAVSSQPHGGLYACAVSLSPTDQALAAALGMDYDPSQITIPTLVLAAAENDVITPDGVQALFDAIGGDKVAALRSGANHGQMLYWADGYVTAWLMWHLQGDQRAGRAFAGEDAELMGNSLYLHQQRSYP